MGVNNVGAYCANKPFDFFVGRKVVCTADASGNLSNDGSI
jgi:hypothetical protein